MTRANKQGAHRVQYDRNRKRILRTQNVCGICGNPVDRNLKYPDPMCGVVDHIIPINKGGHPSDIDNLQLAHNTCNRAKSDKLFAFKDNSKLQPIGNRNLPQSRDWSAYKAK